MSANTVPPVISSSAVLLAADRLNVSRLQLHQALMPPPHKSHTGGRSTRPSLSGWLDRLAAAPAASALIDTVQRWWSRHPLRLALLLADDAVQTLIRPVAQEHPYRLVLGAAAAGGLLVLSRPWRWLPRAALTSGLSSALVAGMLPTLISQVVAPSAGEARSAHNQ